MRDRQPREMDLTRISHPHHQDNLLASLQEDQGLVDLSLICQTGQVIKTHKIVLAAASPMLRSLLQDNDKKVLVVIVRS